MVRQLETPGRLMVFTGKYKESVLIQTGALIPPLHLTLMFPTIFETSVFNMQATVCPVVILLNPPALGNHSEAVQCQ